MVDESVSVHSIIYETEDKDGEIHLYTTNYNFDHSWMCEVNMNLLDEIDIDSFKIKYKRKNSGDEYSFAEGEHGVQ